MNKWLLIVAIMLLTAGHYFKMLRWKQFIEIYEKPNKSQLLQALGLGYAINFCVPYHGGDIFRILWAGRRMKNGLGLSLATVIMDRYLDVIVVGVLFFIFWLAGFNRIVTVETLVFYTGFAVLLILLSFLFLRYSKVPKRLMYKFSGVFNENIELKLMHFFWTMISSFKDMYQKIKLGILIRNTIYMWGLYILSYFTIGKFISSVEQIDQEYSTVDIFMLLFSKESLNSASVQLAVDSSELFYQMPSIMAFYIILPLILLLFYAFVGIKAERWIGRVLFGISERAREDTEEELEYKRLLPQVNKKDRLQFLETYFEGNQRNYLKNYMEINQNISIIKDYSAGSNATTLLCMDRKQTFFRKYAFGSDADKLNQQIHWLQKRQGELPVTPILRESYTKEYCYYDMPYQNAAISMFQYVHSMPIEKSKNLLGRILEELCHDLYDPNRLSDANKETEILSYIEEKVLKNQKLIYKSKELKNLLEYEELIINGKTYKNFPCFEEQFSEEHLKEVFQRDELSEIHGDLTIENIICLNNTEEDRDYYLIDPNTGNLLNSPNLDYAKLLQSLHGGYEFLMNTQNVTVQENKIDFLFLKSTVYEELLGYYVEYLKAAFSKQKVKSIFYHELVHWIRLMPYKINKDGKRAVIFYAGFVMVLNDILKDRM